MTPSSTRSIAHWLMLTILCGTSIVSAEQWRVSPREKDHATQTDVSSVTELEAAIRQANLQGGHAMVRLSAGYYLLRQSITIRAPHVSLVSKSGHPQDVTIAGDSMSESARIGNLIRVAATDFELRGITLERSGRHLVQIAGESGAHRAVLRDCVLRDSYEQLVKVSWNPATPQQRADNGLVENCVFEYSAGMGPQYYIGGIDAHGARRWVVRGNLFRNISSPSQAVAEFAIHFWSDSADNLIEKNAIIDCDRGIGFGLDGRPNLRGVIRNNIIHHTANAQPFADVGIAVMESPGTIVHNNTLILEHGYPWSIEYRFRTTQNVRIFNNLTNRPIVARDGARATLSSNVTRATPAMFVLDSRGVPRLNNHFPMIANAGEPMSGFIEDYFGQPRSDIASIDIGAEQRSNPTPK